MNYAILGAGAWGTAMAIHLAKQGMSVSLVPRRMEHALEMASSRKNDAYLPGYALPYDLQILGELKPALMESEVVFLASPIKGLRDLCQCISNCLESAHQLDTVIALCKGLEPNTGKRASTVIQEELPHLQCGTLSGPSFASELASGLPTAITFACETIVNRHQHMLEELSDTVLRIYLSHDLTGVEVGSCLKNIYAIGAGISDGLGLGENAKAAYLSRALHEMSSIGVALGGQQETFYGLSGMGDLIATAHGKCSRNRQFGEAIGKGHTPEKILAEQKTVVEGYHTTMEFYHLTQKQTIAAPILEALFQVLHGNTSPGTAIETLMKRPVKHE